MLLPLLLTLALALADPAPAPASAPPPPANTTPAPAGSSRLLVSTTATTPPAPGSVKTADELLAALERTGSDIRTLEATMRWTKQFGELEGNDRIERGGRLIFRADPAAIAGAGDTPVNAPPRRKFQVDFTSTTADNARHIENETFIFDGEWFVERHPERKQIVKRQVVPAGQPIDPLAIGEGPFPIPIGQKRDRILERFEATLLPPGDGFPADKPLSPTLEKTYQLRLVPRRGTDEARQFREVRIWYRHDDLLPRLARTTDKDDSSTEVFLTSMKLNEPLPPGAFDTATPPGWDEDIREYRKTQADE